MKYPVGTKLKFTKTGLVGTIVDYNQKYKQYQMEWSNNRGDKYWDQDEIDVRIMNDLWRCELILPKYTRTTLWKTLCPQ